MLISLKAARVNANMSQKAAAAALNVSARTLREWEAGGSSPRYEQMVKLCDIYHMPMDFIELKGV